MTRSHALTALVFTVTTTTAAAQEISVPAEVFSGLRAAQTETLRYPEGKQTADAVALPAATAAELASLTDSDVRGKPPQIGLARELPAASRARLAPSRLNWVQVADGSVATFLIRSQGAAALRAGLVAARVPEQLELRFFGTIDDRVFGPVLGSALKDAGADVTWSPVIEGDTLGVELFLPKGVAPEDVRLEVPRLSHLVDSARTGFRRLSELGQAAACEIDIACSAVWTPIGNAVAKYVLTSATGQTFKCTGTLITDTDTTTTIPYFLTADHCISNQAEASSINTYWFFQRASCGGANPTAVTQVAGGATIVARGGVAQGDYSLLRLNQAPPAGTVFAGWTAAIAQENEVIVGVHHPRGDVKKVSAGQVVGFTDGDGNAGNTHIGVVWSAGITEPGSSGSPLFRNGTFPNQQLIGILTGGSSFCTAPNSPDWYGRFDRFYSALSPFLNATSAVPAPPVLIGPSGATSTVPTYSWNASSGATWYQLWVTDSTGNRVQEWYTSTQTGCAAGGTCSINPTVPLAVGNGQFWVRAYNTAGYSAWSAPKSFTVGGATTSVSVASLYPVANTSPGGTARLWARVQNTGTGTLPGTARVWFYVSGPNWTGSNWVGSAPVADIAPGTEKWAMLDWVVPADKAAGSYTYWARVYTATEAISPWSPAQTFNIGGASSASLKVTAVYPVGTVLRGGTATLWARVSNTGSSVPPVGTKVWFWVTAPNGTGAWVGGTVLGGIAPGVEQWFSFAWSVPAGIATGTYTYWAQVWSPTAAISPWSAGMPFPVQ